MAQSRESESTAQSFFLELVSQVQKRQKRQSIAVGSDQSERARAWGVFSREGTPLPTYISVYFGIKQVARTRITALSMRVTLFESRKAPFLGTSTRMTACFVVAHSFKCYKGSPSPALQLLQGIALPCPLTATRDRPPSPSNATRDRPPLPLAGSIPATSAASTALARPATNLSSTRILG